MTLDWEWAGVNDPLFDLVVLHCGAGIDDAALPRLARAYLGRDPEAGRLEACEAVFWLREYGWAAARIAAGDRRREIVAQRDLGERRLGTLSGRQR
jgi:thiamine kinase-like enzyme